MHTQEVELYFATNAMTFIVGWCWICTVRDVATLVTARLAGHNDLWVRYAVSAMATFVAGPLVAIVVAAALRRVLHVRRGAGGGRGP